MNILLIPVGSAGDVHPFVGVGLALRERGHAVTVLTNPYFEALIRRVGLGFQALGTRAEFESWLVHPDLWHPRRALPLVIKGAMVPLLRPVYQAIAERAATGPLVVAAGTLALGARVAQEKLGVPLATVHLQPGVLASIHRPPALPGLFMPRWMPHALRRLQFWLADQVLTGWLLGPPFNAFRAEVGLPPVRRILFDWAGSPQLVLGLFPDWFGMPQPDWPPQVRLTGFPLYDERGVEPIPAEVETFLQRGEPPVVFTPGSAMRHGRAFFAAALDACRRLGRRGMFLTRFADQLPPQLPDTVRHFAYVPFSQVLPRAAALVHHGGVGTCAQGLAAGVPQLVMPLAHDQPDNAARLIELGVARTLKPKAFHGPAVAQLLDELLRSREVAERCREVKQRFESANALERTCQLIEELGQPTRS